MNPVQSAIMVPHPPIILPNIGKGEEKKIADVADAYEEAGKLITDSDPDTVIIISPHAPCYYDYMQISDGERGRGDMGQFGDYADSFDIPYDTELVEEICALAQEAGLPAGTLGQQDGRLDHGTMIPLYYLKDLRPATRFVRVAIGGPSNAMHYQLGQIIRQAAENLGRKIAVVGSGDLSHCQKAGTNYGFKACGPEYDREIMDIMGNADFLRLVEMPEEKADEAMVCGHKPFCVLAGTLDGQKPEARALAHSAEFGVGYGVVTFSDLIPDESRHILEQAERDARQALQERMEQEDEYVALARAAVEAYVRGQEILPVPAGLNPELAEGRAGAFVSIHKNGQLRGCIGTTAPTQKSLAAEIIQNAISASSRDPRFPAIQPWELPDLEISVDVLKEPEPVSDPGQLDVHRYGVIVSKGRRRGLLLPDLDGVDSVEQQIAIAKQKAGLDPQEPGCSLQRFEVVRHAV